MTDKRMLELAAKAAGIEHMGYAPAGLTFAHREPWNPITDDGDAFRLAVKLRLEVITSGTNVCQAIDHESGAYGEADVDDDRSTAARLAIVRAAAEIGKSME